MLRVTQSLDGAQRTIKVEGRLAAEWVKELDDCWQIADDTSTGRELIVDLTSATFIDAKGKALLAKMYARGARFRAGGCMIRAIVEEIARTFKNANPKAGSS
jgi:anti-anti-sigma regulatory factor